MTENTFEKISKIAGKEKQLKVARPFLKRKGSSVKIVGNELHLIETTEKTNWLSLSIEDINTYNKNIKENNIYEVVHYKTSNQFPYEQIEEIGRYSIKYFDEPQNLKDSYYYDEKIFVKL